MSSSLIASICRQLTLLFFFLNHISTKNSNHAVHILKPQSTEVWPWLNCYPLFDKAPVLIKVVSWFSLSFCIWILDILSKLSWGSAFCSLISLWFQCLFLKKQSKQKPHLVFSLLLSLALKLDLGNQIAFFLFFLRNVIFSAYGNFYCTWSQSREIRPHWDMEDKWAIRFIH